MHGTYFVTREQMVLSCLAYAFGSGSGTVVNNSTVRELTTTHSWPILYGCCVSVLESERIIFSRVLYYHKQTNGDLLIRVDLYEYEIICNFITRFNV